MPIDIEIQDERGGTIARYDGPFIGLGFVELASQESTCFRFIDPWGDTTFNQAQIEVLLEELTNVLARTTDSQRRKELEAVIDFVKRASNSVHTYVKFIGD